MKKPADREIERRDDGDSGEGMTTEIKTARKRKQMRAEGKKERQRGRETDGNPRESEGNGLHRSSMSTSLFLIDF